MNQPDPMDKRSPRAMLRRGRGAPVTWVLLYGLLCGLTALVPIFPYVGGGGYVSLAMPLCAIAPLLLGAWGGIAAAVLGGVLGAFIAPDAYALQLIDVVIGAGVPALLVAMMVKNDVYFRVTVPLFIAIGVMGWLVPFYVPGESGGFGSVPEPLYFALAAFYWLPSTLIALSPLGRRWIPAWLMGSNPLLRYLGVFLTIMSALLVWWLVWTRPFWYLFNFSSELGVTIHISYSWWVVALSAVTAVITIPLVEALGRSTLPKIKDAIW